uniref:Enoyl reductase (ER) domain-containing protein n=1 Tax=Bicosoecida sp. CB-2014 TaxID=1486930 RepID=A0A7S1C701_9STRA
MAAAAAAGAGGAEEVKLPTTMMAIVYGEYGDASVMKMDTALEVPPMGADDVLIETHAASVNPVDWKIASGAIKAWPQALPIVPGWDVAGVVKAVGASVESLKVGDEVYSYTRPAFDMAEEHPESKEEKIDATTGAYAEYAVVKAWKVAKKPTSLGFVEAAGVPLCGLTAWQGLTKHLKVVKGETVLVLGGSGGVGGFGVQWAKHLGATVIATCSAANVKYVTDLGADTVVDYRDADAVAALAGTVDKVLDCVGGDSTLTGLKALKDGGAICSTANYGLGDLVAAEGRGITGTGFLVQPSAEQLTELAAIFDSGAAKSLNVRKFPLGDAGAALMASKLGRTKGKIVLTTKHLVEEKKNVWAAGATEIEGVDDDDSFMDFM